MNEWHELKRVSSDIDNFEKIVKHGKDEDDSLIDELALAKENEKRFITAQQELRQLLELSKRLSDDANKIEGKKYQVTSKEKRLSYNASALTRSTATSQWPISPLPTPLG